LFIKTSDRPAIILNDREISYESLLKNIQYFAEVSGEIKSTKVAIYSENRPEWIFAFYAAWKNENIVVPIDFMATADEVAYIINDCKPEILFISASLRETFENAQKGLKYKPAIFYFEDQQYHENDYQPARLPETDVNKTAVIIYTSGTTGSPKGVMLSYDNILANLEAVTQDIDIF
jgi:long-chain acyl-CoA synthetase